MHLLKLVSKMCTKGNVKWRNTLTCLDQYIYMQKVETVKQSTRETV